MNIPVPSVSRSGGPRDRLLKKLFRPGFYRLLETWPEGPYHVVAMTTSDGILVLIQATGVIIGFGPLLPHEGLQVDGRFYVTDAYDGVLYFNDEALSTYDPMVKIRVGGAIRLEEVAE